MIRLAVAVLAVVATGCGSESSTDRLTVLAAASLTDAFTEIAAGYTAATGVDVELITAGSSTLATQLAEGAPADVVALANEATMMRAAESGRVGDPLVFAANHLVLAVPRGNPAGVTGIDDLDGRVLAVCAPQVPCGRLTVEVATANDVRLEPTTEESSVRSVRTKIELGEVDAGFIYATDITDDLAVVPIAGAGTLTTSYPIAVVDDSSKGGAFVDYVLGADAQLVLDRFGFTEAS